MIMLSVFGETVNFLKILKIKEMLERSQVADAGKWECLQPALSNSTLNVITGIFGFQQMTPVQASTIPLFLTNKDCIVEAVTGSGKSLAFIVPIIELLMRRRTDNSSNKIGALIISPTRELARQLSIVVGRFISPLSEQNQTDNTNEFQLKQLLVTGGSTPQEDRDRFLQQGGAQIIIATPGKLDDLIKLYSPDLLNFRELEVLVMDEADRLLDLGFESQLRNIMNHLPKQRRTALFSATMTEGLAELARAGLRNPVRVTVKVHDIETNQVQRIPSTLQINYCLAQPHEKLWKSIRVLMDDPQRKCIMFFSTCLAVDYFYPILSALPFLSKQIPVFSLHGKMNEKRRRAVFESFNESSNGLLICTDVAARGLDITDIDLVLHHDPPQDPQAFLHRCGRTARQGKHGQSIVFLHPSEDAYVEYLKLKKIPMKQVTIEMYPTDNVQTSCHYPAGIYLPYLTISTSETPQKPSKLPLAKPTMLEFIHCLLMNDRDLYLKSIKAFVSFLRSYQEHQLKYIFQFRNLDLKSVMSSFFLLHQPKCPELKSIKLNVTRCQPGHRPQITDEFMEFVKSGDAASTIAFKDKHREKQRQEKLANTVISAGPTDKRQSGKPLKQISSWSEQTRLKENRLQRKVKKERKREAIAKKRELDSIETKESDDDGSEWKELQKEERLAKKLKSGQISQQEYDNLVLADNS